MNGKCTTPPPGQLPGCHTPKLKWQHIVTRTDATETTGEIYQAILNGNFTGKITLRIGRHPQWPRTWHLLAECQGNTQRTIVGEEPDPLPLMLRMEAFAERWALAGTMPNVL